MIQIAPATPYPFEFSSAGRAVETLRQSEEAHGNHGISHQTFDLWTKAKLVLAVEVRYPGSEQVTRRYPKGYITDLSAYLEAKAPPYQRTAWKQDVEEFSEMSAKAVLLTRNRYTEAVESGTRTDAPEPYLTPELVSELIGVGRGTVAQRLGTVVEHVGPAVLRSTLDSSVNWQHAAFNLPLAAQQQLLAS